VGDLLAHRLMRQPRRQRLGLQALECPQGAAGVNGGPGALAQVRGVQETRRFVAHDLAQNEQVRAHAREHDVQDLIHRREIRPAIRGHDHPQGMGVRQLHFLEGLDDGHLRGLRHQGRQSSQECGLAGGELAGDQERGADLRSHMRQIPGDRSAEVGVDVGDRIRTLGAGGEHGAAFQIGQGQPPAGEAPHVDGDTRDGQRRHNGGETAAVRQIRQDIGAGAGSLVSRAVGGAADDMPELGIGRQVPGALNGAGALDLHEALPHDDFLHQICRIVEQRLQDPQARQAPREFPAGGRHIRQLSGQVEADQGGGNRALKGAKTRLGLAPLGEGRPLREQLLADGADELRLQGVHGSTSSR